MKNLLTAIFLVFSTIIFAQENSSGNMRSNEEMASLNAKRLTMQLDLTPKQEADLTDFYRKYIESRKEMMQKSNINQHATKKGSEEIRKDSFKMNEEEKSELRKILTAEQYAKWEQLQEKRRKGLRNPIIKN